MLCPFCEFMLSAQNLCQLNESIFEIKDNYDNLITTLSMFNFLKSIRFCTVIDPKLFLL